MRARSSPIAPAARAQAVRAVDALIARVPNYAYFHELKGQMLLEAGKAAEAIAPLRQAVALAPRPGLIRIMLGRRSLRPATPACSTMRSPIFAPGSMQEPLASIGYRQLAMAYQQQGKVAEAELASAEGALIDGDVETAQNFAQPRAGQVQRRLARLAAGRRHHQLRSAGGNELSARTDPSCTKDTHPCQHSLR